MPKHNQSENKKFNNHVSMVSIFSEYEIEYLKGWFNTLKCLCPHGNNGYLQISNILGFCMQCEAEEWDDEDSEYNDLFIVKGLSPSPSESDGSPVPSNVNASQTHTHAAKQKHEKLKCAPLHGKENRQHKSEAAEEEM